MLLFVSYKDALHSSASGDDENEDDATDNDNDDDDDVHATVLHSVDEAPEDLDAFFVHPLTAAASRDTDDGDALALLHEYRNLPMLDVEFNTNNRYSRSDCCIRIHAK